MPKSDTTPEVQKILKDIWAKMPGEKKLLMASDMYETANALVRASLPKDLSPLQLKKEMFLRFYKNDFTEEQIKDIFKRFDSHFRIHTNKNY